MALYGNILEALEGYYGADVMQKVYNRGVQLGLSGNKQWGDYYKLLANNTDDLIEWTTKSGKSVGLWSVRGTTSATEVALSSTTTEMVSVDMALGTEVGEYAGKQIPKLVTAGGTSGSTTVGSFVVGEVLPAIGAVACGVTLGVAVDKLLYKSNPDYWDKKLPTLNPETWDDIILGHDTKIPLLHNTENGKTYLKEDFLLYNALLGKNENWFNSKTEATSEIFPGVIVAITGFTISGYTYTMLVGGIKKECVVTITPPSGNCVPYIFSNSIYLACDTKVDYIYYTVKYDGGQDNRVANYSTSIKYNNKTVYIYSSIAVNLEKNHPKTIDNNYTFDVCGWIALYGNKTEISEEQGFKKIGVTPDLTNTSSFSDIQNKLRQTYPDLYNNSLDIPYYDVDTDTTTTNKWIPTTIPTDFLNTDDNIINKPNNKPVSTNLKQTNDGSYPDNDTENKAKENTITDSVTPSIPDNINPINPILPSEQTPSIVIPSTEVDTGLGAVYVPTISQLRSFSEWLWSPNFIDQIKKLFSDPMQGIIGLHQVYFTPSHDGNGTIHCGYLDSEVSSDYTTTRYIKVDCGSINVKEVFGNVFDYDPLTTIECYLPFIGIVPIKVGDVMRSTLSIEYVCDVLTGACLCNIYVNRDETKCILYTYGGNCAVNYPLSSGSYMGIVSALTGVGISIGGAIATGGASLPLSIAGGIASMMNAHTNVKTSGGYSGNTGAMGIKKPYLIIKNTLSAMPDNYNKYIGNPYNNTKKINECKGFTQANVIHLHGDMLQQEKEEIVNLFNSGVII